uniref:Uncharacterized protein n=1 Tax=Arundo donax TaxID=35708 RepID=A0A0A8ZUJ0_ARUDO
MEAGAGCRPYCCDLLWHTCFGSCILYASMGD